MDLVGQMRTSDSHRCSDRPLRYGIIGCGDMAGTHAMNLALRPDLFQVVAFHDISEDR